MASPPAKALPLVGEQRSQLLALVEEKLAKLKSLADDPRFVKLGINSWNEIAAKFNASNPHFDARTANQLKRSWAHIRRKYMIKPHKSEGWTLPPSAPPPRPPPSPPKPIYSTEWVLSKSTKAIEFGRIDPMGEESDVSLEVPLDDEEGISSALAGPSLPQSPSDDISSALNPNPASHPSPSVPPSLPSTSQPGPAPKSSKKTTEKPVDLLLHEFNQRGWELHHIQMKVEESRLAAEKAKTDAFLALSTFFKNLDHSLNSNKVVPTDVSGNADGVDNASLDEEKMAFQNTALSDNVPNTKKND